MSLCSPLVKFETIEDGLQVETSQARSVRLVRRISGVFDVVNLNKEIRLAYNSTRSFDEGDRMRLSLDYLPTARLVFCVRGRCCR